MAVAVGLLLLPRPSVAASGDEGGKRSGFVFWRKSPAEPATGLAAAESVEPADEVSVDEGPKQGKPSDTPTPHERTSRRSTDIREENARLQAQVATLEQALARVQEELGTLQAKLEAILTVPQSEDTDLTRLYRVQEGDTLTLIAQRPEIYDDGRLWKRIYEANRHTLANPKHLRPGQDLIIPR